MTKHLGQPGEATPRTEEDGDSAFLRSRALKRELLAELKSSWAQGEPLSPEQLLGRWPEDSALDPDVASLLFEDYLQKARHGEPPSAESYGERFSEHQESVAGLIRQHDLIRSLGGACSGGGSLRLPVPGERLFGFRLHHELGRGSFARVFLAAQSDLADRPVVLKV